MEGLLLHWLTFCRAFSASLLFCVYLGLRCGPSPGPSLALGYFDIAAFGAGLPCPQLTMQAPQKADQEGQSEPINHPGVEYKDVQFLAKIILLGTEEHISRLCGVVLLFHLRVGEHVRDLSILVQLLRGELIVVRIKLFPIEWRTAND